MASSSACFDPPSALEAPLVDLWVHQDAPITLTELTDRLQRTSLPPEKTQALISALQRSTKVQIGASVPKAEAERLAREFQSNGLNLVSIPVLTLAPIVAKPVVPYEMCPACGGAVHLTASRQCPDCKVFVDAVPAEAQLKHKLQQEERERLMRLQAKRAQMEEEERLRSEIRAELEAKMGLADDKNSLWGGGEMRWIKRTAGLALVGALMGAGYGVHMPWSTLNLRQRVPMRSAWTRCWTSLPKMQARQVAARVTFRRPADPFKTTTIPWGM